jgi:hypothetical protein
LRSAIGVLDRYDNLAIEATQALGPAGFLLVERYGSVLEEVHAELGLKHALAVVAASMDDLDILLQSYRPRSIADAMRHLNNSGLLEVAAGTPNALRLVVEFGNDGESVLKVCGPRVAELIYSVYPEGRIRNAVVQAIVQGGLTAAVAAEKHGSAPQFQRIIERDGALAILAVASACSAEEARQFLADKPERSWTESLALTALRLAGDSGTKTIHMIDRDGLERAETVANSNLNFYQFLPLYDLSHLGGIVVKGYLPTRGEFVWAGVDAALIAVDVVSLLTFQPEGVVASEAARTGIKASARTTVKKGTRTVVSQATSSATSHAALVASRQVMREAGESVMEQAATLGARTAETAGAELAETLARRSTIRITQTQAASGGRHLMAYGHGTTSRRLVKYVAANGAQAAVGLVAVRKMEEYLEGRDSSN